MHAQASTQDLSGQHSPPCSLYCHTGEGGQQLGKVGPSTANCAGRHAGSAWSAHQHMCRTAPMGCMPSTEASCRGGGCRLGTGGQAQDTAPSRYLAQERRRTANRGGHACSAPSAGQQTGAHAQHRSAHVVERTRDASTAQQRMPRTCAGQHTRGGYALLERMCRRAHVCLLGTGAHAVGQVIRHMCHGVAVWVPAQTLWRMGLRLHHLRHWQQATHILNADSSICLLPACLPAGVCGAQGPAGRAGQPGRAQVCPACILIQCAVHSCRGVRAGIGTFSKHTGSHQAMHVCGNEPWSFAAQISVANS